MISFSPIVKNTDALVATGQGLLGNNMFAYCRNNPVIRIDINDPTNGAWWDAQSHLQNAPMYNQWWDIYFAAGNPTQASAMEFAKFLAWLYDLEIYFLDDR